MTEDEIRDVFARAHATHSRVEATWKPEHFFQYGYFRDWPEENVSQSNMPYWSMSRFYVGLSTGRKAVLLHLANRTSSGGAVLDPSEFVHARILRRVGRSWANNPVEENPAADDGSYRFVHSCPGAESGQDIQLLRESERQITRQTFAKKLAPGQWEWIQRELGYDRYMPISRYDWQIGYYKGVYRGVRAVFLDWSAMEYIFTLNGKLGPSVRANADERARRAEREGRSEDELREAIRRGEVIPPEVPEKTAPSAYWFDMALAGWLTGNDHSRVRFMVRTIEELGTRWEIAAVADRPDWPWWAQPDVQAEVHAFLGRGLRSPPRVAQNPDEPLRDLERRARLGDKEAAEQLSRLQWRSAAGPVAVFSSLKRGDWVGIRLAIKTKHGESRRFHRRWIAETPVEPARFSGFPRLRRVALLARLEVGPEGSGAHQGYLELNKNGQIYWWINRRATRVAELRLEGPPEAAP